MPDNPATSGRIVVVGAGISGLAAAWELCERIPSAEVIVLEAAPSVGGKLRLAELAGVAVDVGAEALLTRRGEGVRLVETVGLGDELIAPLTLSAQLHVNRVNYPLPAGTLFGIPGDINALRGSGVLSDAGLERVAAEPTAPPLTPLTEDIAVGALVRARLGDEVVERLVEPLLGGVYAGRADALSVEATMPALAARLRDGGGSLVHAAASLTAPPAASTAAPAAGVRPVFVSLPGGLARLALEVARRGRFVVRTGVTVRSITRGDQGFVLEVGPASAPECLSADAVIVATPAAKAARLVSDLAPVAAAELAGIETASMAIVSLAFEGVSPPAGSGLLVGAGPERAVKAITLSSQKWPGAPAGLTLLRASVGRAGQARDLQRDDSELIALVGEELGELIGIRSPPIDALVTRWGGGLPQFGVGHVGRVARIRAEVARVAGLAVCGASYDGVGIPACIASATRAVDVILASAGGGR